MPRERTGAEAIAAFRADRRELDGGVRLVHTLAPNVLDRQFTATAPNQKWVADFTYVSNAKALS